MQLKALYVTCVSIVLLGIFRITPAAHMPRGQGRNTDNKGVGRRDAETRPDIRDNFIEDASDDSTLVHEDRLDMPDRRQAAPLPPQYGSSFQNAESSGSKLEHRLLHHIRESEKRVNRRLAEKMGALNQSLTLRHLQRLYHHVSEEVQLSKEAGEERAAVIESLRRQLTNKDADIDGLQSSVTILQDKVQQLAEMVDALMQGKSIPQHVSGSDVTPLRYQLTTKGPTGSDAIIPTEPSFSSLFPRDCHEMYRHGTLPPGGDHYMIIQPYESKDPFKVICQTVNQSGWTLIQRRQDGSVDFYRTWQQYKRGFGTLESEFWLGNDHIHHLTNQGNYRLRVEMEDWEGSRYWAEYDHFRVEDEADNYRLHIHGYQGNAGDSLTSRWNNHDGRPFSTRDQDNDNRFYDNCAELFNGAWWFTNCFESHLNGVYYLKGSHNNFFVRNGIQWNTIHRHSSLRSVVMMVKPNDNPSRESRHHDNRLSNDIQ